MTVSVSSSKARERCVILVPVFRTVEPECDASLREIERRGYEVRRVIGISGSDCGRNQIAADALRSGFEELMWIDADIVFQPDDVDQIRNHPHPFVCGIAACTNRREFSCTFLPDTPQIVFGKEGGLLPIQGAGFSFVLTRRTVYETIQDHCQLPSCNQHLGSGLVPWFMPIMIDDGKGLRYLSEEEAFCERARHSGIALFADTSIRLHRLGSYGFNWEEAAREKERFSNYTFTSTPSLEPAPTTASSSTITGQIRTLPSQVVRPARTLLQREPEPLPESFPRLKAYFFSYEANRSVLEKTLHDFRQSDWGEEPSIFMQPKELPVERASSIRNYQRMLEQADRDGGDFALICEDDIRVNRSLRHNLLTNPLVRRDQCDFLSLFIPDLIASPWDRLSSHLGYRLAKPLYAGPDKLWQQNRIWGSQALLLSRRFIQAALSRWDHLVMGQDARILTICSELQVPLWYASPCLVQHVPERSAFATPIAYAPDFDADFRLEIGSGFQPPEAIPGWLTLDEAELLWRVARGKSVLELGTCLGRSTVCLAQSATRMVTVDHAPQNEAQEWARRFGVSERIEFCQGDVKTILSNRSDRFELIFIDTEHDARSLTRDIEMALPRLEPQGLIAFQAYPNPGYPDVRPVVDAFASQLRWKRIAQQNYVGVFQTE